MIFQQGDIYVDIDVEATRAYYNNRPPVTCTCAYCRNYLAAIDSINPDSIRLLESFGVNPKNVLEVITYQEEDSDSSGYMLYDGEALLIGTILPSGRGTCIYNEMQLGFNCGHSPIMGLEEPDSLPERCFEFTFWLRLPWVIDEDYHVPNL